MLIAFRAVGMRVVFAVLVFFNSFCALAEPASAPASQEVAPSPRFEVTSYEVSGNTILKDEDIRKSLLPFTGQNKDFADVQRALETLQEMYQSRGFSSVQVILPEQELEQGVVSFTVIESKIANVKAEGNRFFDEQNILRSMPALRAGEPPNSREIASALKLANENPSKQVTVVLKGAEVEGDVNATLKVTDEKLWKALLSLDNTGTRATGHFRVGAGFQYANLFGLDHTASVQYQTSPGFTEDVQIFGASYHIPLYSLGDSLDFSMASSSVSSGNIQVGGLGLAVSGQGTMYGARYNQNFDKRGDYEQKLSYGIDSRMYRPSICASGAGSGCTDNDAFLRPLSLTYSGQWTPAGQRLGVYAGVSANLGGGRNGSDKYFRNAFALDSDYSVFRYGVDFSKALPKDWQAHFALDGQYSSLKLINYEQFGAGGAVSVRGFNERELAGDKGLRGMAELYTPDLGSHLGERVNLRALAFLDFARIMNNSPVGAVEKPEGIASVGAGLRLGFNKALSIRADAAQVIDGVDRVTGKTLVRDRFLHVGIGYLF